jgi:uncharacterized repeat protein (TIGR01451 family)
MQGEKTMRITKGKSRLVFKTRTLKGLGVILAMLGIMFMVQAIAAAQADGRPTPPAGYESQVPDYVDRVPTTEELLATPASIERYVAAQTLPEGILEPANLTTSTKEASRQTVSPGGVFDYTITIANSGNVDIPAEMTDELPADIEYIDHTCEALLSDECAHDGGIVTWKGTVPQDGQAVITISVRVAAEATPGNTITNNAQIVSAEQDLERSAEITVGEASTSPIQFVPFTIYGILPLQAVNLTAGVPNPNNQWNVSWTTSQGATGYEIHEAQSPDFANATPTVVGLQTSFTFSKTLSPFNVYYYRVRALRGQETGPWSNVAQVVGGYRDEFTDTSTGWSIRRSTYREEVFGFYENEKYVMQVLDRWDWGLASPLKPAPRVPYVIDFEAKIVNTANLLSFGVVFGGDWNGQNCPPGISFDEWYLHQNCFNHFYNVNNIFYGPMKLLFERVDRLEWCLECGGSPMKRLGDIDVNTAKDYKGIEPEDWNRYRIEVRADSIKVFAAKRGSEPQLQFEYDDTRWVSSPYFGVFASTDEYNNSTWRFEYFEVMPIN